MADEIITRIPTAQEKMDADFEGIRRLWTTMREHAEELARTRKAMFDAYVKAGFTPEQALELSKSLGLL